MNIKPYDKTIRDLLGSRRQFLIPRFQREYSWEKKNYREFFEDMAGNLTVKDKKISANQYFLGTMLFIGDITEGTDQEIQVVDGQQRLTTITILFSALSDRFLELKEKTLSEQIFSYIMTKDDDGNEVRVLKSKSSYPFFSFFIQDKEKGNPQTASSEEERNIEETYYYFKKHLEISRLKTLLRQKYSAKEVNALSELDILKAIRDQVLNSTFISISTTDKEQANKIFEILNAKGKRLADIDLIKNKIFEVLKKEEPADYAEETWKKIKSSLNTGKETVGLATFYRHFWISTYKRTYSSKLYDAFNATIPKRESSYKAFLEEMLKNSGLYMRIVEPKREDYNNRKEYFWLVQSLKAINDFNIVQARIALLALFDVRERDIITAKTLKNTVTYLENFHFAYTAICSGHSNKLESIYSTFAISVRKAKNKDEAKKIIDDKLIAPLDLLFPSFEEFNRQFKTLRYTKKEDPSNVKTKYAINKINCLFSKKEIFEDDGSVEHLIPETAGEYALGIGNLILLEQQLNSDAGEEDYKKKEKNFYSKSNYQWIKAFCAKHPSWDITKDATIIDRRASKLARFYYKEILGREIP